MEHQSFQTGTNLDNYQTELVIVNLGNWMVDRVDLGLALGRSLIVNQDQVIEQVEQALDSL
jgi:hypothetical protein